MRGRCVTTEHAAGASWQGLIPIVWLVLETFRYQKSEAALSPPLGYGLLLAGLNKREGSALG